MHSDAYLSMTEGRWFSYYTTWARTNRADIFKLSCNPIEGTFQLGSKNFPSLYPYGPITLQTSFFKHIQLWIVGSENCRDRGGLLCVSLPKDESRWPQLHEKRSFILYQRARLPTQSPEFIFLCAKSHHW